MVLMVAPGLGVWRYIFARLGWAGRNSRTSREQQTAIIGSIKSGFYCSAIFVAPRKVGHSRRLEVGGSDGFNSS